MRIDRHVIVKFVTANHILDTSAIILIHVRFQIACVISVRTEDLRKKILEHSMEYHNDKTFSLRMKQFSDKTGRVEFLSIHFKDSLENLVERRDNGEAIKIDMTHRRLYFVKSSVPRASEQNSFCNQNCQTDLYSDIYSYLPDVLDEMKKTQ